MEAVLCATGDCLVRSDRWVRESAQLLRLRWDGSHLVVVEEKGDGLAPHGSLLEQNLEVFSELNLGFHSVERGMGKRSRRVSLSRRNRCVMSPPWGTGGHNPLK